jgi:hypothetical protein
MKGAVMEPEAISGGEAVQRASKRLSEFLTDEVLGVFQEAARDEGVWKEAIRGPGEFLRARGFETPDDVEVMLYETAIPTDRPVSATAVEPYCEPPLVAQWVPAVIKECARKVVIGSRDWDADLGGFVLRGIVEYCLVWSVRFENRWYCALPQLAAAP